MMIEIWVWDQRLILRIKIKILEFGIKIGYWDGGLKLQIVIGDLDRRLRLSIGIGY